jgi:hypothetical protein
VDFKKGEVNIQDVEVNIRDVEVNIQDVEVNIRDVADPAGRMHRERVHGKCGKGKTGPYADCRDAGACPAIRTVTVRKGQPGLLNRFHTATIHIIRGIFITLSAKNSSNGTADSAMAAGMFVLTCRTA